MTELAMTRVQGRSTIDGIDQVLEAVFLKVLCVSGIKSLDTGFEQCGSQDSVVRALVGEIRLLDSGCQLIPDLIPIAATTEAAFIPKDLDLGKGFFSPVRLPKDAGISQGLVEFQIDLIRNDPLLWIIQCNLECCGCMLKLSAI